MALPAKIVPYQLLVPVEVAGKTVEILEIRRPTVRDNMIANLQEDTLMKEVKMISNVSGLDEEVVQDLDMYDFSQIQDVLLGFRKKPVVESSTGETSSAASSS